MCKDMYIFMGQYRHTYFLLCQLKGPKSNNTPEAMSNT